MKLSAKDKIKEARLYATYGLKLEAWKNLHNWQSGKCAICKKPAKILNVDHRHVKNYKKLTPVQKVLEVRGLLCLRCNKFTLGGLEIHKNAREILESMVEYARIYPLKGDK